MIHLAGSLRACAGVLLWRTGIALPLAAAGALALAIVERAWVASEQAALERAVARLASARGDAARPPVPTPGQAELQRVEAVRKALPHEPDVPQALRALAGRADIAGLAWRQGEYRMQTHRATRVVQLQVAQPAQAGYPQLREHIAAVLRDMPHVSLDRVVARRDSVARGALDVRLEWSVWAHATPLPPAAGTDGKDARTQSIRPADGANASRARPDPFAARDWTPPAPVPAPAAPEVPRAPPVPYVVIGKKLEQGAWEVYLARGEMSFIARPGAVIEGHYRVERIEPPAMTLTYLPLGEAQTVPVGETR